MQSTPLVRAAHPTRGLDLALMLHQPPLAGTIRMHVGIREEEGGCALPPACIIVGIVNRFADLHKSKLLR